MFKQILKINILCGLFICHQISSANLLGKKAPLFEAKTALGKTHHIKYLHKNTSVFIYFINESCPTNARAFPLLKEIYDSYAKQVKNKAVPFYGVINTEGEDYLDWQKTYLSTFPIFLDPHMKIIRSYQVARSPWVVKIDQQGKISKIWQGYSQNVLDEINNELAKTLKTKPFKIDFSSAPKELRGG